MRTGCDAEKLFCPAVASTTISQSPAGTGSPFGKRAGQRTFTVPVTTAESTSSEAAPLTARVRTRAGLVTVKRIGRLPWPPTNRALSTFSWRTTSTCPRAE